MSDVADMTTGKTHVLTVDRGEAGALQLFAVGGGLAATNSFMVADNATRQAVIFDAPDHTVGPLLDDAQRLGLDVIGLWLTHGHFDHLADHAVVREHFPQSRLLIHELDLAKLHQPGSKMFPLPFEIPPGEADELVTDGQELRIGAIRCEVIFTPGHSPGHVMYHFPDHELLVGGDLIIGGAVGRTDLPDSSEARLFESIKRVMQLPGETMLLPGHGQPSRLEQEAAANPYVRQAMQI